MELAIEQNRKPFFHPKKFIVYLIAVSSVMLFAGLSSAVIVSKLSGEWMEFDLPTGFIYSSIAVICSSVTLHIGYLNLKKNNISGVKTYLLITLGIALVFLCLQFYAFSQVYAQKIVFGGSQSTPSGSYLYILATLHALHLIAGIGFVLYVLSSLSRNKIDSKNMNRYEGCQVFWHFLGGLWIYLYVFLIIYYN